MPVHSIDELKTRFTSLLADGRIDLADAQALIAQVKDGDGVTQSERRQLREQFIAHKDAFDPEAKIRMDRFIREEIPNLLTGDPVVSDAAGRRDLPDPAVRNDDRSTLVYEWVAGQLFVDGPSERDVVQGQIADCFLAAAFGAVAAQAPQTIRDAITDNGDGTYTVRFYQCMWDDTRREVKVTIDGQLPTRSGSLRYAKSSTAGELWVPLLEKAYAAFQNGYDKLDRGGRAGRVMTALVGRSASTVSLGSTSAESVYAQLQQAIANGCCATATTYGESQAGMYAGTGIYAWHVYSVLCVGEENGKKYVVLRNPWGEVEPGDDGQDDGVFRLDLATFSRLFNSVEIA